MANFAIPNPINIHPSYVFDEIIPAEDMFIQKIPQLKGEPLSAFLRNLDTQEAPILRLETYSLDARIKKLDDKLFDLKWSTPLTTAMLVGVGSIIPVIGWTIAAYGTFAAPFNLENESKKILSKRNLSVSDCAKNRWKRLNDKTIELKTHILQIENDPIRSQELTQCKTAYIFLESKKILFMVK